MVLLGVESWEFGGGSCPEVQGSKCLFSCHHQQGYHLWDLRKHHTGRSWAGFTVRRIDPSRPCKDRIHLCGMTGQATCCETSLRAMQLKCYISSTIAHVTICWKLVGPSVHTTMVHAWCQSLCVCTYIGVGCADSARERHIDRSAAFETLLHLHKPQQSLPYSPSECMLVDLLQWIHYPLLHCAELAM